MSEANRSPDLMRIIAEMDVNDMRWIPMHGASYNAITMHKLETAAYQLGLEVGARVRTLVHDDKLYIIRVA